jgi:hypothetical protein
MLASIDFGSCLLKSLLIAPDQDYSGTVSGELDGDGSPQS